VKPTNCHNCNAPYSESNYGDDADFCPRCYEKKRKIVWDDSPEGISEMLRGKAAGTARHLASVSRKDVMNGEDLYRVLMALSSIIESHQKTIQDGDIVQLEDHAPGFKVVKT